MKELKALEILKLIKQGSFTPYLSDSLVRIDEAIEELELLSNNCDTCNDFRDGRCNDYKSHYCKNNRYMENRWTPIRIWTSIREPEEFNNVYIREQKEI